MRHTLASPKTRVEQNDLRECALFEGRAYLTSASDGIYYHKRERSHAVVGRAEFGRTRGQPALVRCAGQSLGCPHSPSDRGVRMIVVGWLNYQERVGEGSEINSSQPGWIE